MGPSKPSSSARLRARLRTGPRSGSVAEHAQLASVLGAAHPPFWAAVVADARVTARYRGERHAFSSRLEALAQVVRLMWVTESFVAQVAHRARVALRVRGVPVLPTLAQKLSVASAQVVIGDYVVMEPGIYLPHGNVVIDGLTGIAEGATIRPFVTIGLVDGNVVGPRIGPRARIGTGAKVIGPVTVGARAQVGANAVVLADVPAGASAVGVPARVVP